MKRSLTILCAAAMAFSSVGSFAQDRDHGPDRDRRDDRGAQRAQQHQPPRPQVQRNDQRRDDSRRVADQRDQRGAGPNHEFRRGGRLPQAYRSHQYVVDNWRSHRLSAPPRGYHWVQTGPDYVLVAIATGIIAQVLLNQ